MIPIRESLFISKVTKRISRFLFFEQNRCCRSLSVLKILNVCLYKTKRTCLCNCVTKSKINPKKGLKCIPLTLFLKVRN